MNSKISIQGHRGFRGHYPENTITAFIEAIKCGADTLEMDVVISKDNQVVVSHEAWMNELFCTRPDGIPVENNSKEKYNLYNLNYFEIKKFDCGSRGNPEFPSQKKIAEHKPLLSEVFSTLDAFIQEKKLPLIKYNIEIKTEENGDNIFNPTPKIFVEFVREEIKKNNISPERVILQSFDVRILQEIKKKDPEQTISLLVENKDSLEINLDRLGFDPEIYGPEFILTDEDLIEKLQSKNIKLIPWTVNEISAMKRLIEMGVDGIISDYPDRVVGVVKNYQR